MLSARRAEREEDMTKANKEVLKAFRRLNREFDESITYPDWVRRRVRVLIEYDITVSTWRRLVESICA